MVQRRVEHPSAAARRRPSTRILPSEPRSSPCGLFPGWRRTVRPRPASASRFCASASVETYEMPMRTPPARQPAASGQVVEGEPVAHVVARKLAPVLRGAEFIPPVVLASTPPPLLSSSVASSNSRRHSSSKRAARSYTGKTFCALQQKTSPVTSRSSISVSHPRTIALPHS